MCICVVPVFSEADSRARSVVSRLADVYVFPVVRETDSGVL